MSVLKSQRKESKFEVFHHFYKMRKEITNLVKTIEDSSIVLTVRIGQPEKGKEQEAGK